MFAGGTALLRPPCAPPPGAVAASASVISPGTELRRMGESEKGSDQPAGYMNIAYLPGGEMMLAPEPHGAWIRINHSRALTVPPNTGLPLVAAARFQLIAAAAMSHPAFHAPSTAVVAGSGPVALGCCLELLRRGTVDLILLTSRDEVPFARDLGIKTTRSITAGSVATVIDATGRIKPALSAVAPGGTFGLLGTPDTDSALSALRLHRQGVAMIGMHELVGYNHSAYQNAFSMVLAWLSATYGGDLAAHWCVRVREEQVLGHYRQLAGNGSGRGARPITIVEWAQ